MLIEVFVGQNKIEEQEITYLIHDAGNWRLYCFASEADAQISLGFIKEALIDSYPDLCKYAKVTYAPQYEEKPYRFRLSLDQHRYWSKKNQEHVLKPNNKVLVKSIR